MARTKNRGQQKTLTPAYTIRRWRPGKYIRLSKEDLKKGRDDSNSVKNQRNLLDEYQRNHPEEFESASEYVDDGHTGTDADRERESARLNDLIAVKERETR